MLKYFSLLLISFALLQSLQAQQSAQANVSVNIISPLSVKVDNKTVTLETFDDAAISIPLFLRGSAKQARPSRLSLPVSIHKVNFASLSITDNNAAVFDITLPNKVTLKNADGSENVTAYQFEYNANFEETRKLKTTIELSAMVAITTDQFKGVYTSLTGEVIVNYN